MKRDDALFDGLIKRFGREMLFRSGELEAFFFGILQPLRYKNKMYLNGASSPIGYDNRCKYLLISPAQIDFGTVESSKINLTVDGEEFRCDHSEMVYYKGKPAYCWSIVHRIR